MKNEKAKNAGVSLFPSEIAQFKAQATAQDGGSLSRYFRRLAAQDTAAFDRAHDGAHIIENLASEYAGYLAPPLRKHLVGVDQARLLHALLLKLSEDLAATK